MYFCYGCINRNDGREFQLKNYERSKIKNIALAGHAGSGKTSLTEALLYKCGATDRLGKVADGNTVSDYTADEIKRKCSVYTSLSCFETAGAKLGLDEYKINLLDTPGLFDYASGMTEIARQNSNDAEKVDDCLKKVSLSSKHLMSLINDVLDMSKIESGKIQLKNELFDLRLFLENIENIYSVQAEEKGIDFDISLSGKIDKFIVGDSLRLNQILTNLLSNAFKFTPNGGKIVLGIGELKHEEDTVLLRFSVKDTGIGIKEENLEKIFEAFEQENAEISHKFGGTGLGLSIVRRFSELMGGSVTVHSEYGKGAEFSVDLPFGVTENSQMLDWKTDKTADQSGIENKTYDFSGKHILLAEDNELNREIAVELLGAGTGAIIDEAEDGEMAVDIFAASEVNYYDLILMDIQMPHMDGFEATRRIRAMERPDAAKVPIFAMTANAFAEDEEKSRQAGMNAHLSKPLEISAVLAAMNEILNRS